MCLQIKNYENETFYFYLPLIILFVAEIKIFNYQAIPLLLKMLKMTFDNATNLKCFFLPENINKPVKRETQQYIDRADLTA